MLEVVSTGNDIDKINFQNIVDRAQLYISLSTWHPMTLRVLK